MPEYIERINAERWTCESKKRYRSMHDAEEAARLHESMFHKAYRVYDCIWCRGWHLTTKEQYYAD